MKIEKQLRNRRNSSKGCLEMQIKIRNLISPVENKGRNFSQLLFLKEVILENL
jgi:hypothetical protein